MVELKCVKGDVSVNVHGNTAELCADVLTALHALYGCLYDESVTSAVHFREIIEHEIHNVFIVNPNIKTEEEE